jgi:hypothetical protein
VSACSHPHLTPAAARISIVALLTLAGCSTVSPAVPRGWSTADRTAATARDAAPVGQMQIIICYGPVLDTHAALRLVAADGKTIFWDPGGGFGARNPRFHRTRDLLMNPAPTLEEFRTYRRQRGNHSVAVFEWDMPASRIELMQQTLINQTIPTSIGAGGCTLAVSRFLRQCTGGRPTVPQDYRYPHDLSDYLWTQSPSRVHLFPLNNPPTLYVRASRSSGVTDPARRPSALRSTP